MMLEELGDMEQEQDLGGKLIWFVAGAAIGASLALLYAPASGGETRKYISKKTREGGQAIADSSKDMYDAIAESSKDMYERGKELYERGRKMADEAAELLERGRSIVEKATEGLTSEIKG